jgi:hypothetical protein
VLLGHECWSIQRPPVCPSNMQPQVSSYRGHYITFLHLQVLWPIIEWHVISVVDCNTAVNFFYTGHQTVLGRRNNCPCTIYGPILPLFWTSWSTVPWVCEMSVDVESVICPVTQFVELCSKAFVFLGIYCLTTAFPLNKTMISSMISVQ